MNTIKPTTPGDVSHQGQTNTTDPSCNFDQLFRDHWPQLQQAVRRSQIPDPDFIAGGIMIRALHAFDPGRGHFGAFVNGVKHKQLRSEWRKHYRSQVRFESIEETPADAIDVAAFMNRERSGNIPAEQIEAVRNAISKLPELEQKIAVLRFFDGYGYEEIASQFGMSASAIRSRLTRKYAMLRHVLGVLAPRKSVEGPIGKAEICPAGGPLTATSPEGKTFLKNSNRNLSKNVRRKPRQKAN